MPRRRIPQLSLLLVLVLVTVVATAFAVRAGGEEAAGSSSADAPSSRATAAAWQGLVGEAPADVSAGQRMIVVLDLPSLADRVTAAGGRASDREERRWTAAALTEQRLFISRLVVQGAQIRPEFRYARVLNGFSATLDPRALALLERAPEVEGIYPVRVAYPATVSTQLVARSAFLAGMGARPEGGLPGFDGRGVTIALLDTGVDRRQPYLSGRLLDGVDIVGGTDLAEAAERPDDPTQLERHGTQLAGIMVGAGGPSGLSGVAPGASIIPVRVAGWQRDSRGGWAVYSRTDQVIAGLERAVDPNDDGDAHDAARVALVGVTERYAAFAEGASVQAVAGATRLDTLVVTPGGNDGPAGPGFGSVSGPGGAPAALTVAAADLRQSHDEAQVTLRAGLDTVLDSRLPLAGAVAPEQPLTLELATPTIFAPGAPAAEQAAALSLEDFFSARGLSRVAGRAALLPAGPEVARLVKDAARAGAGAVLLYGARVPAGALGLRDEVPVPVVAVPAEVASRMLLALRRGESVSASIGLAEPVRGSGEVAVAAFSSQGLAFDGRVKPEVLAPGVALGTSEPGTTQDGSPRFGTINGSSASAAAVAGAAAVLAQARPDLDAATLKGVLVGSARPLRGAAVAAQGAGLVDLGAAAGAELAAQPTTLAFGRATRPGWRQLRRVRVRNLSTRTLRLRVGVLRRGFPAADAIITARPARLTLRPGRFGIIRIEASVELPARAGPPVEGALVLQPPAGRDLRVPFAIPFGSRRTTLLEGAELSQTKFKPSDTVPSVLSLQAGRLRTVGGVDEVEPVERLDLVLFTGTGKRIGVIARLRTLLPGRYAFGITGRDPGGQVLKPGDFRLQLVAVPVGGGPATRTTLPFTIR